MAKRFFVENGRLMFGDTNSGMFNPPWTQPRQIFDAAKDRRLACSYSNRPTICGTGTVSAFFSCQSGRRFLHFKIGKEPSFWVEDCPLCSLKDIDRARKARRAERSLYRLPLLSREMGAVYA